MPTNQDNNNNNSGIQVGDVRDIKGNVTFTINPEVKPDRKESKKNRTAIIVAAIIGAVALLIAPLINALVNQPASIIVNQPAPIINQKNVSLISFQLPVAPDDPEPSPAGLNNDGVNYSQARDYVSARRNFNDAKAIFEENGNDAYMLLVECNIANIVFIQAEGEAAELDALRDYERICDRAEGVLPEDVIAQIEENIDAIRDYLEEKDIPSMIDVPEIEPDPELSAVTVEIDLDHRSITDAHLEEMVISGYLPGNVTYLSLKGNQISDISPLGSLTELIDLNLGWNHQIRDISALRGLTNLTWLFLDDNQISDISSLDKLTNLTELYLYSNQISDVSPLNGLTNLTRLYLAHNQISDIGPLSGLTNLTHLSLSNNQISDVNSLSSLTNLTELDLVWNQISDISALSGLTNLTRLNLYGNQISNITPLKGLANLEDLILLDNPLTKQQIDVLQAALPNCEILHDYNS